ncbi:PadR family transcriptional regulator [Bailinhaonella thermotolerans]|nr:PadR family transcriptional regulator [Bailinhaonella thermotolerans]
MSSTRLLILGVLHDETLNGYEIRRRLELWGADQWANVAFGSIYHGLTKMSQEGLLEIVEKGRGGSTVYGITDIGRQEFQRLLAEAWWRVKPVIDPFQAALTFMNHMPKEQLLSALGSRSAQLRSLLAMCEPAIEGKVQYGAPRHITECVRLNMARTRAELDWIEDAIPRIEKDELP